MKPNFFKLQVAGVKILLAQLTNEKEYLDDVVTLCDAFVNSPKSPLGQAFFLQWGSLRYSANGAFICLAVNKSTFRAIASINFKSLKFINLEK